MGLSKRTSLECRTYGDLALVLELYKSLNCVLLSVSFSIELLDCNECEGDVKAFDTILNLAAVESFFTIGSSLRSTQVVEVEQVVVGIEVVEVVIVEGVVAQVIVVEVGEVVVVEGVEDTCLGLDGCLAVVAREVVSLSSLFEPTLLLASRAIPEVSPDSSSKCESSILTLLSDPRCDESELYLLTRSSSL